MKKKEQKEIIDPAEVVEEIELNETSASIEEKIRSLSEKYANALKLKIDERVSVMKKDDNSHYLVYQVLGISNQEGELIDVYQNKGRFLYKYAGSFLEAAAILCFKEKFSNAQAKVRIPNTIGQRPATFEIDCLIENDAYEIKWRDATTDGDHITKEHTRLKNISNAGYRPIRVMFYYPNRDQAIRIQQTLRTLYLGFKGEYYFGDDAWEHILQKTGVDLKNILVDIAKAKTGNK